MAINSTELKLGFIPVKPFLKWAGGKQALAELITEASPNQFDRYFEPFVGGGSIFFALQCSHSVICDQNDWLIDTYTAIRDEPAQVAEILRKLPNTREDFLRIRSMDQKEASPAQRAAHLIYLNKTCFRGLFRVNREGRFNVPYGEYNRRYYDPENLQRVSELLKGTEIRKGDFEYGIYGVSTRDFVYFDPPYYKYGGYSDFNRYTPSQFREHDHIRLAAVCRELDNRGVQWALTNSNTTFVRALFHGFRIRELSSRREINLDSAKRNMIELLITNY